MSPEHIRIAELAKEDKERKFSSIAHLLTVEALKEAFENLRKDASAGVDGVAYTEYAKDRWDKCGRNGKVPLAAGHGVT